MKTLMTRLSIVCVSLFIIILALPNISDAKIDSKTIEGLWLFDEGSGNVAQDLSGNGYHGEILGAKWVSGKYGEALEFDGVDDDVVINNYFGIEGIEPRTTCLWFQAFDTRDHSWVKWGPNVTGEKYYVRAHPDGDNCYLRIEVAGGQCYGVTNVCDGEWHHLAVVFPEGSDSVKDHLLYVDSVLEGEHLGNDQEMNTNNTEQEVHIGAPLAHHTFAYGLMDEVAIFNVALTERQITEVMEAGLKNIVTAVSIKDKLTTIWAQIKAH
jgi:hypothetical protein